MNPDFLPDILKKLQPTIDQANEILNSFHENYLSFLPPEIFKAIIPLTGVIIVIGVLKQLLGGRSKQVSGSRSLRREAKQFKNQGNFQRAGELFEMGLDFDAAEEMYQQGERYRSLGHLYELKKDWAASAGAYEAEGDIDQANHMYQKSGQFEKAAEILVRSKRDFSAAELYERAGNFSEAARLYERSSYPQKAASCYEREKSYLKAAELYEQFYTQEKVRLNISTSGWDKKQKEKISAFALQSGRLYQKANNMDKAAKVLVSGGYVEEAAKAYVEMKQFSKAAELYHKSKRYREASDLYQKIDQPDKAHRVLGEMYIDANSYLEAAWMYEKATDFLQAGDLYEKSNQISKAAEMCQKGGDINRAYELFQSTGDEQSMAKVLEQGHRTIEAANLYIKLGDFEKAARLFEEANEFYEAGKIFYKLGRIEDTISFFQKVEVQSPHYFDASIVLGKIFIQRGMLDTAKERFKKLVSKREISSDCIEPFYHLAVIYEKNQDYSNALLLYDKITAENYQYKDVPERLLFVKEALKKEHRSGSEQKPWDGRPSKSRYQIEKKIGQGGMGVVYRAKDTLLDRIVAYKVLPPSVQDHPTILENFLREARVAAGINHTNIVTIYDTGTEGTESYIVMELIDGVSLKQIMDRNTFMPLKDLIHVTTQICDGLEHAHSKNVIHRDIKPANIMLRKDHVVKIMDFGLAKILTAASQEGTSVKGTPLYMSPEQIRGERVDHRTDLYSLGCTLYRMAAGRPPFMDGDIYYHHINTTPAPPSSINPRSPDWLDHVILKTLEKDPSKRYQNAGEIRQELTAKLQTV